MTTWLTIVYLLETAVVFLVAVGAGSVFFRMRSGNLLPCSSYAIRAILGMGMLGLLALLLGIAGILIPVIVAPVLILLGVYGGAAVFKEQRGRAGSRADSMRVFAGISGQDRRIERLIGTVLLCAIVMFVVNVTLGALAPDAQQDSLWYHLGCARAWAEWHRVIAWPLVYPSNFPLHGTAIYSLLMLFGDDINCALLYALQGFLTYAVAAAFAQLWFGGGAGLWAFFLCATAHGTIVWFVPINIGNDLTVAMFSTPALLLPLHLFSGDDKVESRSSSARLLYAAGLMAGFAAVTKLTALGFTFVPWLALCAFAFIRIPRLRGVVVAAILVSVIPIVAWGARNYFWGCGNPLFPILRDSIGVRSGYEPVLRIPADVNSILLPTPSGIMQALSDIPKKMRFAVMSGSPGFVIHGLLCLGIFHRKILVRLAAGTAILQWGVYLFTRGDNETIKYFAVAFPAALVIVAGGIEWLMTHAPVSQVIRTLSVVLLALMLLRSYIVKQYRWGNFESISWGYRPVLDREERLRYLESKPYDLSNIRLYDWINRNTSRESVIMFADIGYPLHVQRRYLFSDEDTPYFTYLEAHGVSTSEMAEKWLIEQGIDYVIAKPTTVATGSIWNNALEKVGAAPVTAAQLYKVKRKVQN